MSRYKILLPDDYVRQLVFAINKADRRIQMIALVISEDEQTSPIIDALVQASKRGVKVDIGMDLYFTYKELGQASSKWKYFRAQINQMRATKNRLEAAGAEVRWLGQFGATMLSRRTHIKWSVVDDTVFSFGGINLYDLGLMNNDYMFTINDKRLAERLSAEHELVISTDKAGRSYPSHTFGVEGGAVLVDGGRMFDSVIYRRACSLAEQAEKVIYVSQYCPTGKLGRILKRRNVEEIYFNRWQSAEGLLNGLLIRFSSLLHGIQTKYRRDQYLHGKFMLFYMYDGRTIAITGSHNFVASGGALGTREIALESYNEDVVNQLEAFLEHHVKTADD